jgi:peptidoglycan hydrolase-like protein with peptidoglycan-binding domain
MVSAYVKKMLHRSRGLIAAVLMAAVALPVLAAELDCERMLADTVVRKLDKATVSSAQRQLLELGFNPEWIDGLLGSKTSAALMEFCTSAQFARSGDLLTMLGNHAAIFKVYPDWETTLASKDFLAWAARQPDAAQIGKIRQSGDSTEVIAVLGRYGKRNEGAPLPANDDENPVSYILTKDDFTQLKAQEMLSSRFLKLQSKTYADKDDFETAANKVLKGAADQGEYVRLAEKSGEQQTTYKLTKESFDELKVVNVPDYVLQALEPLKDLDYPDSELETAVNTTLGGLGKRAMGFLPEIVKLAVITPAGGTLTDTSLAKFAEAHQGDLLAAAVQERVSKLQGEKYRNNTALSSAVKKMLSEITAEIDDCVQATIDHAQESSAYVLDKVQVREISQKIKESAVPELFLELIASIQDVDYPDPDLFWRATKAKVEIAGDGNAFRKTIWNAIEAQGADKVDQTLLSALNKAKLPPALLDQLTTLQDRKFSSSTALENAISNMFKQLGREYEQFRPLIVAQARKQHPFDKTKTIQWDGGGCKCVQHSNLEGEVYGLYPYWMAGEKQTIDFGVQTRIGYYGLSFDDKGNIPNASRWKGLDTKFIREARTYGTRVDMVIYRSNWRGWTQAGKEERDALFQNLAANITALVETPLTDWFSKMKPFISLGGSSPPVMGDGVTLDFTGYPQDAESVEAFYTFIKTLSGKLRPYGRKFYVNIMFRSADMGKGIYDYNRLLSLIDIVKAGGGKLNSLFLVLLEEPTTSDKKRLRLKIENGVHGTDRVKLLRNVVTVLTYDGQSEGQLADDVIYAKDNFGGIGFWTQPVALGKKAAAAAANASVSASSVLNKNYVDAASGDTVLKPAVCRVVCPNKWAFRIVWDIFVLALLGSIPLYFARCEWRNYFDKHFMHFIVGVVGPFLLVTFGLLFCDPSWEAISRGNGPLIFLIAAILAYAVWSYRDRKRKADLP